MIPFFIKALIIINIPLIPLLLARGKRWDRIWFAFYILTFLASAYLISYYLPFPYCQRVFFLLFLSLLSLNLSFSSRTNFRNFRPLSLTLLFFGILSLPPFLLPLIFFFGYNFQFVGEDWYFSQTWSPSFTLVILVLTLLNLTLSWEKWKDQFSSAAKSEQFFPLSLLLWWTAFLFFIAHMIYTGDKASFRLLQLLTLIHLLLISLTYFLIFRKEGFLKVQAHPSPHFIGAATRAILVLLTLTLFFWLEALSRSKGWILPNYSFTIIGVIFLAAIILFPALPLGYFQAFQRLFYHHLYLPEQDFAIEVAHYLRVMRGEETPEQIVRHLQERLKIKAALIYRLTANRFHLWVSFPPADRLPYYLSQMPEEGATFNGFTVIKSVALKVRSEVLGYLLLFDGSKKISFEEESLIRFWSETLGLLLNELELKERQAEHEKLAHFAQAASFLLHDAKNLTQLLDLTLKNYRTLPPEDLSAFLADSESALTQAQKRAEKILTKLETFQPPPPPVLKATDIQKVLTKVAQTMTELIKKPGINFYPSGKNFLWKGDEEALKRIMENLILNSLQAEAPEPKVEVRLEEETGGYHIQVRDWGNGVAEENWPKLFKPFFTTKRGGSGLGLYQAKTLVETLGGKIWHEPNLPQGSIFHVWLTKNLNR